mgnify:CR=1 FL=1
MTQTFDREGHHVPVTVLQVGPCTILQVKKKETDGYQAVQLGFDQRKESKTNKGELGHFKKFQSTPRNFVREIRTEQLEGLEPGKELQVNNFAVGDYVDVVGTSKGKGFQGVVKRHHFSGVGGSTHGQHDRQRAGGSVGASSFPSRVFKGTRMPGRMGGDRVKARNLEVLKLLKDKNLLIVKGSVPGSAGSFVIIHK